MAQQNIFDNQTFFEGYKKIRENEINANNLFEIPALFSLLPDLKGMKILDLGCGFGEHCKQFIRKGADKVIGIDISEKMLETARKENCDPKIEYINMPMENLSILNDSFDAVISSLALHYVEDFSGVVRNVYSLLNEGGIFVFSQGNPLSTCFSGSTGRWTKDENGKKLYLNLKYYCVEGEKESTWFVDGVKTYHRMFSTIINTLTGSGFIIEKMIEPLPDDDLLKNHPEYSDLLHKPDFLIIRARKAAK